ncbi:MAG: hypothetical protein GY861_09445 [bacterium]|nr:hypothetical protein [bacterium]
MKKILLILLLMLVISSALVSARCTFNGEEVPCDVLWNDFGKPFIITLVIGLMIAIPWSIFTLIMIYNFFIRVLKNPKSVDTNWVIKWVIIFGLTGGIGAIVYYFKEYRKKN